MDTKALDYYRRRHAQLKQDRSSWDQTWKDISKFQVPRRGRWSLTETNKGADKTGAIIDNTATRAVRTLAAGLMSGGSSPARPWFVVTLRDRELARRFRVKRWLHQCTEILQQSLRASNAYEMLAHTYEEIGPFGTAASMIQLHRDPTKVVQHLPLTVGEYALQTDFNGDVTTIYREFSAPAGQLVREFGLANCSAMVKSAIDAGNPDLPVLVTHAVEPRQDRDPSKIDNLNMPWVSVYFEQGGDATQVLRESGYDKFPALTPRWSVVSNDPYGESSGMDTIGDTKSLQQMQKRLAQCIDTKVSPPLQIPAMMKNREVDRMPGGLTPTDLAGSNTGIRPLWDVNNLDPRSLEALIEKTQGRINSGYYTNLFLMLANLDQSQMTAFEIAKRTEEVMVMLAPVYERSQRELYEPLIRWHFEGLQMRGMLPPPPEEMLGTPLSVEFISVMAQAQKAVGTVSIDRLIATIGVIGNMRPEALDKLNVDETIDRYSEMLGAPPQIVVPTEETQAIRQARAQAQMAKEQMVGQEQQAKIAKDLAAAKTGASPGANALTDVMSLFSGYGSPPPQAAGALNI